MRGIITVVGKDKVGIIARVCTLLYEKNINILDISQTIVQGYFNMMMIVELNDTDEELNKTIDLLDALGKDIGVDIKLQHESIFNSMHRI